MNNNLFKKIVEHPDKDEILSKLIIGVSIKDIHEWLKYKYVNVSESKFVISEKIIKSFKENYLDIYKMVQEDLMKTKTAIATHTEEDLQLMVKDSPMYKDIMLRSANEELDIRKIIKNLCIAIETRLSQVFDEIQSDPQNINTKVDRLLIEYADALGNLLEKNYKFIEAPANQVVQHNVTLQVVDQHISIFYDVIKEVLSQMDLETSLYFIEVFNKRMNVLQAPEKTLNLNSEVRLAEVKLLNETMNKKINEY